MQELAERAVTPAVPLLQLRGIAKRFVQPVDVAGRIANLLGAHNRPEGWNARLTLALPLR
jgi:peptide/nickel transport system ATP-binding protein